MVHAHAADADRAHLVVENYRQLVQAKSLELGIRDPGLAAPGAVVDLSQIQQEVSRSARKVALVAMADIAVFFAVLMVGFAYVWRRGDLDWVRAVSEERTAPTIRPTAPRPFSQPVLTP